MPDIPLGKNDLNLLISETLQLLRDMNEAAADYPAADPVLWPFHSAYRADAGTEPTTEQKALIPWRESLASRNSRLRTHYIWGGREQLLQLYPLAGFGSQVTNHRLKAVALVTG